MKKFPLIATNVNPLYKSSPIIYSKERRRDKRTNTILKKHRSVGPIVGEVLPSSSRISDKKFEYRSRIKIVNTKMYEPVADGCVTIVNSKCNNKKPHDQSDVEDECSNACERPNHQQPQQQRRKKLQQQKEIPKQSQIECDLLNRRNCAGDKMRTGNGDNYIDVDHITLESELNYKNRFHTIATQTSTLLPYRLRFWPKCNSDIKCDPSGNSSFNDKLKCCGRTLSQWIFSQLGLIIILFNWALLGAAAFYKTEGPRELQQAVNLETLQKDLSLQLATSLRQVTDYSQVWPRTIAKYMARHESLLLDAVSQGYGEGGGGSIWTYPGCLLFAVSLLTTLGFGAPVPRTPLGRGAAVLFSGIGIPLHFLLILNIGNLVAGKLQLVFSRKTESSIPVNNEITTTNYTPSPILKWFPLVSIIIYYVLGAILFGFVRRRSVIDSLMFPLDFTAAGGVALTSGHVRIFYAMYLESAVMLAATIVSLIQASATRGIVDVGLKLGLLTNT